MTPYDRAWDMGSYTEYMTSYDGICQVVRIPDVGMILITTKVRSTTSTFLRQLCSYSDANVQVLIFASVRQVPVDNY